MYFPHSLLKCGWLWAGDNLYLLWDYQFGFILRILPAFAVEPQYQYCFFCLFFFIFFFINIKNIIWRTQTKSSKIPCMCTTWMGFVGQLMNKLETSFIRCFLQLPLWCPLGSNLCKHAGGHSVTNKQRVLMHRHQGWNVRHGLCHIYMRY